MPHFGELDAHRHRVLLGIAGSWQVAGGNKLGLGSRSLNKLGYWDMVQLDLDYIQNWSIWRDFTLLAARCPPCSSGTRVA